MPRKSVVLVQDDFGDGTQSLAELTGTGAFSEAGGKLIYDLAAGQNGDWWTSGRNSRAAVAPLGGVEPYNQVHAEATFAAFSGTANSELYFNLYKGDVDWYQFFIDSGGANLYARRMVGAAVTNYASVARPAYPFRVRLVWNRRAGNIEWWYNALLGAGWVKLQAEVAIGSFVPTHALFGGKNWSTFPAVHGEWDDLLVTGIDLQYRGEIRAGFGDAARVAGTPAAPEGEAAVASGTERGAFADVEALKRTAAADGAAAGFDDRLEPLLARFGPRLLGAVADLKDETRVRVGATAQFNGFTPTLDGEGHPHFTVAGEVVWARVLDLRRGFGWSNPVTYGLTGYAKDGKRYTAGVQDPGPVWAPWASEAASNNRSSRKDAPDQVLAAFCYASASSYEFVLFDLDGFPTTLDVWMRFLPKSSYSMVGNFTTLPWDAAFFNGVLAIVLHSTVGRLHLLDFRSDGQDCCCFIGSDDHWIASSGKTLVNRNDDGGWYTSSLGGRPELRILNENPKRVEANGDASNVWAVTSGEDSVDVVEVLGMVPQRRYSHVPSESPANATSRVTALGPDGWLWFAQGKRVVRNVLDHRGGVLADPGAEAEQFSVSQRRRHRYVELPYNVTSMCATRNWVFCGTEVGVYRIHKVSLALSLAYTIAGGGGGGRDDAPPAGEVLLGTNPAVLRVAAMTAQKSSYLLVASQGFDGGVTVVRLFDNVAVFTRDYDTGLREPGANFTAGEF